MPANGQSRPNRRQNGTDGPHPPIASSSSRRYLPPKVKSMPLLPVQNPGKGTADRKETHVLYGFDAGRTDRGHSASRPGKATGKGQRNGSNQVPSLLRGVDQLSNMIMSPDRGLVTALSPPEKRRTCFRPSTACFPPFLMRTSLLGDPIWPPPNANHAPNQ